MPKTKTMLTRSSPVASIYRHKNCGVEGLPLKDLTDKPESGEPQRMRAPTVSRVSTSLRVKLIMMRNQNNPAPAMTQVSGRL